MAAQRCVVHRNRGWVAASRSGTAHLALVDLFGMRRQSYAPNRFAAPARTGSFVLAMLAAACGSTSAPPRSVDPQSPGGLTEAQVAQLTALEQAYRKQAADQQAPGKQAPDAEAAGKQDSGGQPPDYPALRAAIATDPVATAWFTRMLIRDLFTAREGRPPSDDDDRLRAAAQIKDPVEARALDTIAELGPAAVPTVVSDLLRHAQPLPRELGYELVARIGAPALPPLLELASDGEPKHRRAAARSLGLVGADPRAFAALKRLAEDGEFDVRGTAMRGLGTYGDPAAAGLLRERLQKDRDAFVRRAAAQALAAYPTRATAEALIDYLDRCDRSEDRDGARAAQEVLRGFAKTRGGRTVPDWRRWLATWQPPAER